MKTTNAMQLKAKIKNRAKRSGVSPQLLMQDYLLERLLERVSKSQWRDYVVVKGGMLIASFIGVDSRVTKDLDTTIQGFALTHESAERAFREIASIEVDDDIAFEFLRTEDIRETDEYPGIRVFLSAPRWRKPFLTVPHATGTVNGVLKTMAGAGVQVVGSAWAGDAPCWQSRRPAHRLRCAPYAFSRSNFSMKSTSACTPSTGMAL